MKIGISIVFTMCDTTANIEGILEITEWSNILDYTLIEAHIQVYDTRYIETKNTYTPYWLTLAIRLILRWNF